MPIVEVWHPNVIVDVCGWAVVGWMFGRILLVLINTIMEPSCDT
jgi:hypothetical protein